MGVPCKYLLKCTVQVKGVGHFFQTLTLVLRIIFLLALRYGGECICLTLDCYPKQCGVLTALTPHRLLFMYYIHTR